MNRRARFWLIFALVFAGLAALTAYELIASPFEALFLSDYAKRLTYRDGSGPSDRIVFPRFGPYDIRFGYTRLPDFEQRLRRRGFEIVRQARISPEMAELDKLGLFLPYREKSVGGLTLEDCAGNAYFSFREPRHAYPDFASIPPIIANTLVYIENRNLLEPNHPLRNPAVEWDRLAVAILDKMVQMVQPGRHVPGGSTLATQIEKYRHSRAGLTITPADKLRQMASASVHAYLDGPDTRATRRRIVLNYLNTVPLSAAAGFGEVNGLGDGLEAWFGLDFSRVNRLLTDPRLTGEAARAYKHVLALLISQRKPSWYLGAGRSQLDAAVDTHLGLLARAGVITPAFAELARREHIRFMRAEPGARPIDYTESKAATATRLTLASLLGVGRLYDLDRLDLTVDTSLHIPTQQAVLAFLAGLKDPARTTAYGLYGQHLLQPGNDLNRIIYSFTLYERTPVGAARRVQADSLDQPFNINQSAKLGMGSTAKLRTLITYLQIIADLHDHYGGLDSKALAAVRISDKDVLGRWALDYLRGTPDRDLTTMLRAAMARRYSADPSEVFYTGGGIHRFANFEKSEDHQIFRVQDAFQYSVNLAFVRLMRDIVRHYLYQNPNQTSQILDDPSDPRRAEYLHRFADQEGTVYLIEFYKQYRGLPVAMAEARFLSRLARSPRRLAAALRYLEPNQDLPAFTARIKALSPDSLSDRDYKMLYETYAPGRFNLADRAYIARVHPLELWLIGYLLGHPHAHWDELHQASRQARQESYRWLFRTDRKHAQDIRIRAILEEQAYAQICQRWQRLGYPFSSIVPSYATAIGSSADRPSALSDLMGIILNNGVKQTSDFIGRLNFGADTPYHTVFAHTDEPAQTLLRPEIAHVVRDALIDVVTGGTATRVNGAFATPKGTLTVGGKTGTGDNRFETFAANGTVLQSRAVNRVATFVFFIGRHFYGVITAFVPGEAAAGYSFSSALPAQVLRAMAPVLDPLLAAGESRSLGWEEDVAEFEAEDQPEAPAPPGSKGAGTGHFSTHRQPVSNGQPPGPTTVPDHRGGLTKLRH